MADDLPRDFWFKAATAIGGVLSVAFLAWAGVVYEGVQSLTEKITEQIRVTARLEVTVTTFAARMAMHEQLPWHPDAGEAHARSQERLDAISGRLNHVEQRQNERGRQ